MRTFLVEIDENVYDQDISLAWLLQTINVELDDCFSNHIRAAEVTSGELAKRLADDAQEDGLVTERYAG